MVPFIGWSRANKKESQVEFFKDAKQQIGTNYYKIDTIGEKDFKLAIADTPKANTSLQHISFSNQKEIISCLGGSIYNKSELVTYIKKKVTKRDYLNQILLVIY